MKSFINFFLLICTICNCAQTTKVNETKENPEVVQEQKLSFTNDIDTNWKDKVIRTDVEWKKLLTKEQYNIARQKGTERPFSSPLYDNHDKGIYACVCCNNPLFSYESKFNSGTGWPSFFTHYSAKSIDISKDDTHGMSRDELTCKRCDAHIGHIFNDGPKPTGLRYCIDGVGLKFIPIEDQSKLRKATFAGGCFWCEELTFEKVIGVKEVISGYAGGKTENPTYEEVGSGTTGHAESFEFEYDPKQITYASLLKVFVASLDPTQVNGQGPDHGTQYRSIIFYRNEDEKNIAQKYFNELNKSGKYSKPIAIELIKYSKFWNAEKYHQNYVKLNPENSYVQHESIPRMHRTMERVPEFFNK